MIKFNFKQIKNQLFILISIASATTCIFSCTKESVSPQYILYNSYFTPVTGKYIIYRLDSTVTQNYGTNFIVKSFTIKDSIANSFIDLAGNLSYYIYRYQLDLTGNNWFQINSFVITPKLNSIECVENNLRYIDLVNPINISQSWYGNSYISKSPFYQDAQFSRWKYSYSNIGDSKTFGNLTFNNTITVIQSDSTQNSIHSPILTNNAYFYSRGYEIFADSIGLIYRDMMSYEYQPITAISNCILIKPKSGGTGKDTTAINCNSTSSKCDSLQRLSNYTIKCDTTLTNYGFNGYGIKQTILSHN